MIERVFLVLCISLALTGCVANKSVIQDGFHGMID